MATGAGHGIDLGNLERSAQEFGLGLQDIAQIIGVDQSTLCRWRTGASVPRSIVRLRLDQFGELFEMLRRMFAGPDLARQWLHDARPESFGGQMTPLAVMRQGRIDRVLMLLHTFAAGG